MVKERGVWLREEGKECGSHECFELKQEDKINDICYMLLIVSDEVKKKNTCYAKYLYQVVNY